MSVYSFPSSNESFVHPLFSMSLFLPSYLYCITTSPSSFIFTSYSITKILFLLPPCFFILYNGLQQWRKKCSTSSATRVSHSDCFTYHLVTMELFDVLGCILSCCGIYRKDFNLLPAGIFICAQTSYGQISFHMLMCVERYLAVVHPITYTSLRKERWIRIRNVIIGCVWMFCSAASGLVMMDSFIILALNLCTLMLSLILFSFCSLSILCALIRPGPGEQGGGRKRIDQSKQRALYIIVTILGVLVVRFIWNLIMEVTYISGGSGHCLLMVTSFWFSMPSSLVVPLLFLQRAGKLMCCKENVQLG